MYKPRGEFTQLTPDWFRLYTKYDYRGVEILHFKKVEELGFAAKTNCGQILRTRTREDIAEAIDALLDKKGKELSP
jgi:hypothetical protein